MGLARVQDTYFLASVYMGRWPTLSFEQNSWRQKERDDVKKPPGNPNTGTGAELGRPRVQVWPAAWSTSLRISASFSHGPGEK